MGEEQCSVRVRLARFGYNPTATDLGMAFTRCVRECKAQKLPYAVEGISECSHRGERSRQADPRLGSGRLGSQFGHCELRGRARGQAQMPCQLSSLADKPAFCWPARANPVDNCWHRARYNEVGCTGAQQRGKGEHCVCH